MRLDVSAKDTEGKELFKAQKKYFQIGLDTEQFMRYGAWQIKEYYDLSLQPRDAREERFLMHFDKDTVAADVTVTVTYCLSGKVCDVIHEDGKRVLYKR